MPRPMTENDIKKMRRRGYVLNQCKHPKLGLYVKRPPEEHYFAYAYRVDKYGYPQWVTRETLVKRMRTGHPAKRKSKMLMKDIAVFSMEELEEASRMIDEMGWTA